MDDPYANIPEKMICLQVITDGKTNTLRLTERAVAEVMITEPELIPE